MNIERALRRGVALAAAAIALGGGVACAAAAEAAPHAASCALEATARTDGPGVLSAVTDMGDTDALDVQSLQFWLDGVVTCADEQGGPVDAPVQATGTLNSTFCGTGTIDARADLTVHELPYTIDFHVQMLASQGTLTGVSAAGDGSSGSVGGQMTMVPLRGNCATTNASSWQVVGTLVLEAA